METTTKAPRRDFSALETRRMQAAKLFQRGHEQAEIVHRLHVSRQSASRWHAAWRRKGRAALKGAGRAGRKPRLDAAGCERVREALVKGPAAWGCPTHLWTLDRIATVIWKTCHVRYSVPQTWRVLQGLGWSRQRPARKAKERDEAAIARWVRVRWPEVKKTPNG